MISDPKWHSVSSVIHRGKSRGYGMMKWKPGDMVLLPWINAINAVMSAEENTLCLWWADKTAGEREAIMGPDSDIDADDFPDRCINQRDKTTAKSQNKGAAKGSGGQTASGALLEKNKTSGLRRGLVISSLTPSGPPKGFCLIVVLFLGKVNYLVFVFCSPKRAVFKQLVFLTHYQFIPIQIHRQAHFRNNYNLC